MEKILNGTEGFVDKQPLKNFWYVVALGDDIDPSTYSEGGGFHPLRNRPLYRTEALMNGSLL